MVSSYLYWHIYVEKPTCADFRYAFVYVRGSDPLPPEQPSYIVADVPLVFNLVSFSTDHKILSD